MRLALILSVLVGGLLSPVAARAQEGQGSGLDRPTPVLAQSPAQLSAETVYFWTNPSGRAFIAVIELTNLGEQPLEGIITRWEAYGDDGRLILSNARLQPVLAPGQRFAYVAGAGPANLSESPARLAVSIVQAGRPAAAASSFLAVDDVRIERNRTSAIPGGTDYTVTATATTGAAAVNRHELIADVVLRDDSGAVVGAIFSSIFSSLPDRIPPHTAFGLEVRAPVPSGTPTRADVSVYTRPAH
jgi:hypothetical protein